MNRIKKLTQVIRDNEDNLEYGTIKTLKMIDYESEKLSNSGYPLLGEVLSDSQVQELINMVEKKLKDDYNLKIVYETVGCHTKAEIGRDIILTIEKYISKNFA